jgi:hypothetical protein
MTAAPDDTPWVTPDDDEPGREFEPDHLPVTPLPAAVHGPVLREDALNYTPTARSVHLALRRAERLATEWGMAAHAADAGLIVGELGANALLHGCVRDRRFQVRLVLTAGILRIEVSDARGDRTPRPRTADPEDTFGRGLTVVHHLADRWGTAPRVVGKTVYAELEVPPQ